MMVAIRIMMMIAVEARLFLNILISTMMVGTTVRRQKGSRRKKVAMISGARRCNDN